MDMARFQALLESAERPLMMVGGGGWSAQTASDIGEFAQRYNIPVCSSFRCQDYVDNRNPAYAGHTGIAISAALAEAVKTTDLLISVGARLGELTTRGYELVNIPNPAQRFIHVHPGAEELGRVYRPDLAINAASASFAHALKQLQLTAQPSWKAWCTNAHAAYEQDLIPEETPGGVKLEDVITWLSDNLDDNAVMANGAGNYSGWPGIVITDFVVIGRSSRQRRAPWDTVCRRRSPAKIASPDATVVCLAR